MNRSAAFLSRQLNAWARQDGLVWLHLSKTAVAGLLAVGLSMVLQLQSPRTALATVFVIMQPLSGMVLAKSFYRIIGTAFGTLAAMLLGGAFDQSPTGYVAGLTFWVAACSAAALRYRHFRWYAFVLAGYTAALIGVPVVADPGNLFIAASTRSAEVILGIVCASLVSALVLPLKTSTTLLRTLDTRYANFTDFAAHVLNGTLSADDFEARFATLADEIVSFDATRGFASFEGPQMRAQNRRLQVLNEHFMAACAHLHALQQLHKRLSRHADPAIWNSVRGEVAACAAMLRSSVDSRRVLADIGTWHATLPARFRQIRSTLFAAGTDARVDAETEFDTAAELLYRFVDDIVKYLAAQSTLADRRPPYGRPPHGRPVASYKLTTNGFATAFVFLRTALVVGSTGAFWVGTGWPSGDLALISAALTCALASSSNDPARYALQLAVGGLLGMLMGCLYVTAIYPLFDGFPMLCLALTPVLALGAFLITRTSLGSLGTGFSVYFALLAGPDNQMHFDAALVLNNGIASVVAMTFAAAVFAIVLPPRMKWLVDRIERDLRRQIVVACHSPVDRLERQFQFRTYDLMQRLRVLLTSLSPRHRHALRWMFFTQEVGQAMIEFRLEVQHARYCTALFPDWDAIMGQVRRETSRLFEAPHPKNLGATLASLNAAMYASQAVLAEVLTDATRRHDQQRLLRSLHFIRTALLDRDAPFRTAPDAALPSPVEAPFA